MSNETHLRIAEKQNEVRKNISSSYINREQVESIDKAEMDDQISKGRNFYTTDSISKYISDVSDEIKKSVDGKQAINEKSKDELKGIERILINVEKGQIPMFAEIGVVSDEKIEKSKYFKRTGTEGNYKYHYSSAEYHKKNGGETEELDKKKELES